MVVASGKYASNSSLLATVHDVKMVVTPSFLGRRVQPSNYGRRTPFWKLTLMARGKSTQEKWKGEDKKKSIINLVLVRIVSVFTAFPMVCIVSFPSNAE
jgi:hypothetical protein